MSFKVSVDQESLKNVEESVRRIFNKVMNNKVMLKEVGETAITDIQFQTRRGKSIPLGGKFTALGKKWVKEREKIELATPTHAAYETRRSNLTITGQLLDAMVAKPGIPAKVTIQFEGTHFPYVANYLTHYIRRAGKRVQRINRGPVQGFRSSTGGFQWVNTNRTGTRTIGKPIPNEKLAEYVNESSRPFMGVRDTLKPRLSRIVVSYIRRAGRVDKFF
jgi:hypothetical protein